MQYAHDPRTFLYSHYVYRGLRSATGVIGATLIALQFSDLPTAMVVSMGALCTSLIENGIQVMLRDFGKKADEDFIKPRDLDDIRPGGLGVHLIRSTMDAVSYTNLKPGNRLTLTKYNRSVHAGNRDA